MSSTYPLDERAFDANDWFVLAGLAVAYTAFWLLPKRFPPSVTLLLFLFGATAACTLDNSIGANIFDLYDIMDGPAYSIMDFVVYFLYAPFGYFFIYFYDRLRLSGMKTVVYIAVCSLLSILFEWVCFLAGVFHYKHGYAIYYSYCVYLAYQTGIVSFYNYIAARRSPAHRQPDPPA